MVSKVVLGRGPTLPDTRRENQRRYGSQPPVQPNCRHWRPNALLQVFAELIRRRELSRLEMVWCVAHDTQQGQPLLQLLQGYDFVIIFLAGWSSSFGSPPYGNASVLRRPPTHSWQECWGGGQLVGYLLSNGRWGPRLPLGW